MIRVAVTGGREFRETYWVAAKLDDLHRELGFTEIVHGGAKNGVDYIAHHWARQTPRMTILVEEITGADWAACGKLAGSVRNRRMLVRYKPELLIAFPGQGGTADCIKHAEELGIAVRKIGR